MKYIPLLILFIVGCNPSPKESDIQKAMESLNPTFSLVTDSINAPIFADSLRLDDPLYEFQAIVFRGIDTKTSKAYWEVLYKRREQTE